MILGLRTDSDLAEIWVDGIRHDWQSERQMAQKLLGKIVEFLPNNDIHKIDGIVFFNDSGSFTGLRIGATIANTLANALKVPVVSSCGENWYSDGVKKLEQGENTGQILPNYGREAHITTQKK